MYVALLALILGGVLPFIPHGSYDYKTGSIFFLNIYHSGIMLLINLVIRSSLSIAAVIILAGTTGFMKLVASLEKIGLSRQFVLTLGITYRYLFVLGEEIITLRRAAIARGYNGRWIWQVGALGRLVGNLFLRAYERSERVYNAMISRGFSITSKHASVEKIEPLSVINIVFIVGSLFFLLIVRFLPAICALFN